MWNKAADVPRADADYILGRYDQTAPEIQREIVLQAFLDAINLRNKLQELQAQYDDLYEQSRGERPQ